MERQLPKNVKQIGNVSDEPKIYVEDYVDTYLNQLKTNAGQDPAGAVLVGEILTMDGQAVVYISGAIQLTNVEVEGTEIRIGEDALSQAEEDRARYFPSSDTVGWCFVWNGHPIGMIREAGRIHERSFARDNSIFIWKDALEEDELYYAYKYGELMQMGGHYIYYERNPAMQNYMIGARKKIGVTPSEMVDDRVAKDFRSVVRERMDDKRQHQSSRLAYATSVLLVLVVLVIGISTINNFDKMESVQSSLEALSQTVKGTKNQESVETDTEVEQSSLVDAAADTTEDAGDQPAGEEDTDTAAQAEEEDGNDTDAESTVETNGTVEEEAVGADETYDDAISDDYAAEEQYSDEDYYIVEKGDTLDNISQKVYGNRAQVDAICRMNGLSDGNLIYIGQKLLLP